MTHVKICGIREPAEALVGVEAGSDFVGIVFVPGRRRRVDEATATRVVSSIRDSAEAKAKVVGLFADQPLQEVERMVGHCGLDLVQLCGNEPLDYCDQLEVPVLKVLHVSDSLATEDAAALLSEEIGAFRERGHGITLDRKVEGLEGGTGQSFNWDIARALSKVGFRFLLAGGLTPENVGVAVRAVRPWGVDVSTGVEIGGAKDPEKIRAFISAVRGVDVSGDVGEVEQANE